MVELDGSLGLGITGPFGSSSASGGNRPPFLQPNTKPTPPCTSRHPRHSAIMDGMGLSSLIGRIRVDLQPSIRPEPA